MTDPGVAGEGARFALPARVMAAREVAHRAQALEAVARIAERVTPEQLDSALLTFAPAGAVADGQQDAEDVGAGDAPTGPASTYASGLNPHQALLRDAAETAGYAAEVVSARSLGVTDAAAAGDSALRLQVGRATIHYYAQGLWWAGADGRLGAPLNGMYTPSLYSKFDTKAVLAAAAVPVPAGRRFRKGELADALRHAAGCTGALCVKPDRSANGWLVMPGLIGAEDVAGACATVARFADAFVVEDHVAGEAWRFFWVAPAIVGIKVGRPASMMGDGVRTARGLLRAWNAQRRPVPGAGHAPPLREGGEFLRVLAWQGLAVDQVPAAGVRVFLSFCSNGSRGADSLALRERLHPGYEVAMVRAFRAIPGLQVAAADVMIADPSVPPEAGRYAVVEINSAPSLLAYHHPIEGPVQDVSGAIVRRLGRLAAAGVAETARSTVEGKDATRM